MKPNIKAIVAEYERLYGVKTVPYDPSKRFPKKRVAVEVCEDGTVYEHGIGGVTYVRIRI